MAPRPAAPAGNPARSPRDPWWRASGRGTRRNSSAGSSPRRCALSSAGAPALLLAHLERARAVLVFSEPTLTELATRLMRQKFDRYIDRNTRLSFLAEIQAVAEFAGITGALMGCRDRADDAFLETARMGDCELIVSGDQDLLCLHPWHGIRILTPAEALETLRSNTPDE
ncbi:MAG: putative toxin-antitoxin system toxin component, PIN family [Xanthomonadales bacterium]|nr:putative toxin-antitoxin system toxin component, PIN family [Xanthomonadales bacterium]